MEHKKNELWIPIRLLIKQPAHRTLLYHILAPKGFNSTQVEQILQALGSIAGKQFTSSTHRLLIDRRFIIISDKKDTEASIAMIEEQDRSIKVDNIGLKLTRQESSEWKKPKTENIATIDIGKLKFPLILRKWKKGDYFYPLGLKKQDPNGRSRARARKKLSDYFIDLKLPITEKEKTWVLTSDKKIVWVVGMRIDDRFKITDNSSEILVIEISG
ncbi:MAG: hypothetical protein IH946_11070 [Bacteroidetes bacterium]|nr:hypothetical protein [Bacteroidota bacterium]